MINAWWLLLIVPVSAIAGAAIPVFMLATVFETIAPFIPNPLRKREAPMPCTENGVPASGA